MLLRVVRQVMKWVGVLSPRRRQSSDGARARALCGLLPRVDVPISPFVFNCEIGGGGPSRDATPHGQAFLSFGYGAQSNASFRPSHSVMNCFVVNDVIVLSNVTKSESARYVSNS